MESAKFYSHSNEGKKATLWLKKSLSGKALLNIAACKYYIIYIFFL